MQDSVKQDREKYIGGSDIPVIMSLSPYKKRFDLLLEKAGYKLNDFEGNVFTDYGNALEPKIRDYINENYKIGRAFKEGKHIREATGDEIIGVRIHTDGENDDAILEIKTTSHIYDDVKDYKLYLVQLLYYMVLTGKDNGLLAVYERPEDLSEIFDPGRLYLYKIKLEDYNDLIADINREIESFIDDLAKVKANPFITEEELLPIELPALASRVIALEESLKEMKETEAKIKEYKTKLKDAMSRASIKSWVTPRGYRLTLVEDKEDKVVKAFDETKFKTAEPDLYNSYLVDKIKKGASGYVLITAPKSKEG